MIRYDGFLLGIGVGTPVGDKTPGRTILVDLEVVDRLGQGETGGFVGEIGVDGLVGRPWVGVGCCLVGWMGC